MMATFAPGELQMAVLRRIGAGGTVTTIAVAEALDALPKRVSKAAAALAQRRYIDRCRPGIYRITRLGEEALASGRIITSSPLDANAAVLARADTDGFRDRVWRSMRLRGAFTIPDLVCDAIRNEADAINDAGRYIRILKAAGYLVDMRGRAPGSRAGSNGYKRFRLVRNTGPRAPLHRSRLGIVHDFNTGEDVPCTPR